MTKEEELAKEIHKVNEQVRQGAIEAGEGKDVGDEVSVADILEGIQLSGYYAAEEMLDSLQDCDPNEPEFEEACGKFVIWINTYVYFPLANQTIDEMIELGLVEVKSVDKETGEFTYGLSAKGYLEKNRRDSGLQDF